MPLLVPPAVVFVLLPLVSGLAPGVPNLPRDDLDHLVAVLPELLPAGTTVPFDPEGKRVTVLPVSPLAPFHLAVGGGVLWVRSGSGRSIGRGWWRRQRPGSAKRWPARSTSAVACASG